MTAAFNTTEYYTGFFGLGITQGRFGDTVHDSPLTQAVKQFGRVPSYSYGYTAGAHYSKSLTVVSRQRDFHLTWSIEGSSGMSCSLTLGGYDESRFVDHETRFVLGQGGNMPQVLVRAISVSAPDEQGAPSGWDTQTRRLSHMSNSFEALIDSSTPFLWLPDEVCDEFAEAFSLTYNETLDLYTLDNSLYEELKADSSYSFTFSFSSFDNQDDFGDPLRVPGVVNITVSAAAFAQVLRYPFKDETISYGDPSMPYFALRRNGNGTSPFIIGRAFLQEAYLITRYDSGVFSVHEARFPEDPLTDLNIKQIDQPDNSPLPPPFMGDEDDGSQANGLSTAQVIGIAVGIVCLCGVLLAAWCCCRRRKKAKAVVEEDRKDGCSSIESNKPSTPLGRFFSRIIGRRKSSDSSVHEVPGSALQPAEVGADANHAVYELPAPIGPSELDASTGDASYGGDTEFDTPSLQNLSPYEAARIKLARQLQGPVPAYSPPESPANEPTDEKTTQGGVSLVTCRAADPGSPESSPVTRARDDDPLSGVPPSPMSPRGGWTSRPNDLPSPMTMHPHPFSPTAQSASSPHEALPVSPDSPSWNSSGSRSDPSNETVSPTSQTGNSMPSSSAGLQKTPIDASKVVYLGPIPGHVSSPDRSTDPRLEYVGWQDDTGSQNANEGCQMRRSTDTPRTEKLGSSERLELESSLRRQRIDTGSQLIHVPQLASRRFSWEEEPQ